jgi:hypothetical protein
MKNYLLKRLTMLALLTIAQPLFAAAPYTQVTEVFPPDPAAAHLFGLAAAISDDVAVVGTPLTLSGAAYVYVKTDTGWVFQQKLVASDAASQDPRVPGNQFGWALAVAGDTIVVGAPRRVIGDGKNGAVYVFKRSETGTWTEQAIITSRTPRPFGQSVALQGGTLVVGALEDRSGPGSVDSGLAFVFKRSGDEWIEEASLMTSDNPGNRWGVSVDIRGNTAVVAAADDPSGSGPVYVFSRQGATWTQDTKLSASAHSVSLWGASLAVGATGAVSIYEHVGPNWQLRQTLPVGSGEQFVALREDRLLIGEHRAAGAVGVAYLYGFDEETGQWTLNQTLSPADGQTGDFYGVAVGLSGTAAIIGSPRHFHSPNPQSGAAYIYEP